MPRLSDDQRLFVYKLKVRDVPYPQIATQYAAQFPGGIVPCRHTVTRIYQKMEDHKVLIDRHKGNSGRPRTGRSDDNILQVYESYLEDPTVSIRKRAAQLDLTSSTIQRIMRKDLALYPYRITKRHELLDRDYPVRVQLADWFLNKHNGDDDFLNNIWWSDESHVHLNGYVNSHNAIHWGTEKPTEVQSVPLHSLKITIWCAISAHGLLGPYFFEENGNTVTVNSARYLEVVKRQFIPDLFSFCITRDLDPATMFFMQDGARPHITVDVRNYLGTVFDNRTIGERCGHHWPARSPDLTPCDFFLWGWMKSEVHKRMPFVDRDALKDAVKDILGGLDQETCARSCQSVVNRLHVMRSRNGHHIEQFL